MLGLEEVINKPGAADEPGKRVESYIGAALLHDWKILFLDKPIQAAMCCFAVRTRRRLLFSMWRCWD